MSRVLHPGARRASGHGRSEVEIVPMRRRHVRAVAAVERLLFPRPWSAPLFLSELAQPATRRYYAAVLGGEVIGYAGMMIQLGEGHVTTIGVAEAHQRRKVATRLLLRLVADAQDAGVDALTLEVRASNHGAQRLYHAFGFQPVGLRRNYYPEVGEDAIVMWAYEIDSPAYAQRIARIAAGLEDGVTRDDEGGR